MKFIFRHSLACCVVGGLVFTAPVLLVAQAERDTSRGSAPETAGQASQYQFKLPVPLVIEDVLVLDNKEQPVHGLPSSDFLVTENGKPVVLRGFEEHVPQPSPATVAKAPPLGDNIFTNIPDVPPSTSLNILLLDALNTPTAAQETVRAQLLQFMKGLAPGTRMAIFGLGTQLTMLQGFTDDPAILRATIENKKGGPQISPLLEQRASQDPSNPESDSVLDSLIHSGPMGMTALGSLQSIRAAESTAAVRQRMILTLQGMNELAKYLSVLPGHKNLIWFSGSFPLNLMPNDQLSDPYMHLENFKEQVRQVADTMARGRIAIYPVDSRGVTSNSSFNPASIAVNHYAETHNRDVADAASKHFESDPTYAEHDTMDEMAADTGGKAFYNTNGLKDAVDKIMRYGESYYTFTYSPADLKFDGKYRKIVIKSGELETHMSYRGGYFADDPNAVLPGKKDLPLSAMQTAMLHGVPNAIQVGFDAAILPGENPVEQLTAGGVPERSRMTPPYLSYTVQYIVDIRTVQFTVDAAKVHHGSLELASYIYDRDGNPINSTFSKVNLELPDERFKQVAQQGVLTRQTIEAPVKGEFFLRAGIRDLSNDHVGALEVPLKSLKSLTELRAGAARQSGTAAK